jgi:hypothetical protein
MDTTSFFYLVDSSRSCSRQGPLSGFALWCDQDKVSGGAMVDAKENSWSCSEVTTAGALEFSVEGERLCSKSPRSSEWHPRVCTFVKRRAILLIWPCEVDDEPDSRGGIVPLACSSDLSWLSIKDDLRLSAIGCSCPSSLELALNLWFCRESG